MKKPGLDDRDSINQDLPEGSSPPQLIHHLLVWFHPEDTLEEVTGDLEELYTYRYQHSGKFQANLLYLLNVLSVLPPFVRKRTKRKSYYEPSILHRAMLRNYFKIAFRTIAHNKVYSGINVLGLSIGLAAAMLIMLYTKDEVSYDRFHTNNPNIYRITDNRINPNGVSEELVSSTGIFPGPVFAVSIPEIQKFVRYHETRKDIQQGIEIKSQQVFVTDADFFSVFTFPLLSGNPEVALKNPQSVVISEDMALLHFGTLNALGKSLMMKENDTFEPYMVTGVAKRSPQNSSIKFDILIPLRIKNEDLADKGNWFYSYLNTFVVLAPSTNLAIVETKMNQIYRADAGQAITRMAEKYGMKNKVEYALQPFTAIHLSKELSTDNGLVDGSNPVSSYILSAIALFILGIACINFFNLTVARSLKRAKEIGVRKVMGGRRSQLTLQFLGESFLMCFVGFVLAFILLQLVLPTFNQLSGKALSLSYLFDTELVIGYIALFLITGLLAGFYPALVLSGYAPIQMLHSRLSLSGKSYLQNGLVVLQFTIASFMIIGMFAVYSQFNYLTTKDLGYDDKQVISINQSNLTRRDVQLLKEQLLKNPAIVAVAPKNGGRWDTGAKINNGEGIDFNYETVDTDFLPLFKIPVLAGRNFSAEYPSDSTQSILVNESFVKRAGWKSPLGQTVQFNNGDAYQVIGVVKDYHYRALTKAIGPQLFTMKPGNKYGKVFIKIRPQSEQAGLALIEATFKKQFPLQPYAYNFLEEENRKNYESEAKWKQILLFGAILTIFISCIGLFGLTTFAVERRMKEIGIRKVLGASIASIIQLFSSDFLKLVAFSFVFAFPAAYYAINQWLENYPYRIGISVWLFVGAAALAVGIALFTVSFQSIRAAMINPVKSLKNE
jgi:putative ABC transport system permease protein